MIKNIESIEDIKVLAKMTNIDNDVQAVMEWKLLQCENLEKLFSQNDTIDVNWMKVN